MPAGRPVVWTPEKRKAAIDKILARISTSRDSIATICNQDEELPAEVTFFEWLRTDEGLAKDYTRAKEEQADVIFEEMLDIADDATNDYMKRKVGDDYIDVPNPEVIGRSRLRIETRKWALGKLRPKKYGERLDLNHSGNVELSVTDRLREARERAAKSIVDDTKVSQNSDAG